MTGKIVYGMISPHPPLLIPQIGGARIKDVEKTKRALENASKILMSFDPDTVVMITPHGEISRTTVHIYASRALEGDFSMFGLPNVKISCKGDSELANKIADGCRHENVFATAIPESFLDHGITVPLHFLISAGFKKKVLPVTISLVPLRELFEFGRFLAGCAESSGKKIAIVASADMSHRLTAEAPSGYNPKGRVFDEKLAGLVKKNDVKGVIEFDPILAEEAGQDALWSIAILLGALDGKGFKPEVLSYEGPFGVGYMVAKYEEDL